MRVLLVGATGTVGRRIAPLLAERFDLTLAARRAEDIGGLPFRTGDIASFADCLTLVDGMDAIVNCAIARYVGPDGDPLDLSDPETRMAYNEDGIEINVRGAYHLYEAAVRMGVPRVVFIGSTTVWMGEPKYPTIAADTPHRPREFYACTKLFGDLLGRVYSSTYGLQVFCLHIGQPVPIDDPHEAGWIADPGVRGLLVSIGDVAEATACALTASAPQFGAYPIVSASDSSWVDTSAAEEIGYRPGWFYTKDGGAQLK